MTRVVRSFGGSYYTPDQNEPYPGGNTTGFLVPTHNFSGELMRILVFLHNYLQPVKWDLHESRDDFFQGYYKAIYPG